MPELVEDYLKASKILVTGTDGDNGYIFLPLRQLVPYWEVTFNVYVKMVTKEHPDPQYTLWAPRGQVIDQERYTKLQELGITWVYYSQEEEERVLNYLHRNLDTLLTDENLNNEEKATLVCDVTLVWLRHFYVFEKERASARLVLALRYLDEFFEIIKKEEANHSFIMNIWRHSPNVYTHSLNSCLLGLAFVSYLVWPKAEAQAFGLGALLHDIGMTEVSKEIVRKPDRLEFEEWLEVKKHPIRGYRLLKDLPEVRREGLLMVVQHHENGDGSGYPCGLLMDKIHPWARIMRLLDAYEAITAPRPWRGPRTPTEALWIIRREWEQGNIFDPFYLKAFIKYLGSF